MDGIETQKHTENKDKTGKEWKRKPGGKVGLYSLLIELRTCYI